MRTAEDPETRVAYARWICETKRAFDTRAAATYVAGKRLALDAALRALYAYKCPACQKLHLTKKKVGKALVMRHEPANARIDRLAAFGESVSNDGLGPMYPKRGRL